MSQSTYEYIRRIFNSLCFDTKIHKCSVLVNMICVSSFSKIFKYQRNLLTKITCSNNRRQHNHWGMLTGNHVMIITAPCSWLQHFTTIQRLKIEILERSDNSEREREDSRFKKIVSSAMTETLIPIRENPRFYSPVHQYGNDPMALTSTLPHARHSSPFISFHQIRPCASRTFSRTCRKIHFETRIVCRLKSPCIYFLSSVEHFV